MSGLRLFAVASLSRNDGAPMTADTIVIPFRELGAVMRAAHYASAEVSPADLMDHERVVEEVFRSHTVLPAPCGTVFRSEDHVARWLDMNYVALIEGIHFADGRCEARVHASEQRDGNSESSVRDGAALAAESFRALRRVAIAALPLRKPGGAGSVLSSAFLVERAAWSEFSLAVGEQARRSSRLVLEQTGPWPPYDFVRIDFGV